MTRRIRDVPMGLARCFRTCFFFMLQFLVIKCLEFLIVFIILNLCFSGGPRESVLCSLRQMNLFDLFIFNKLFLFILDRVKEVF